MRRRLYGALGVLAGITAAAVLVTEATKGSCSIVCGWQIPLLVIGAGASLVFMLVALWAIVYEVGRASIGGKPQ